MNETTITLARKIDEIAKHAMELFEAGGSFESEIAVAQSMADMRAALTPQVMAPVMELMNTDLGFRTDRDPAQLNKKSNQPNIPYDVATIRDVVIEAKLRGFHCVGNEFNVIAGRFYAARNGLKRKCQSWPGVTDLKVNVGVPRKATDGAIVSVESEWKRDGVADGIKTDIAVKINEFMGVDAIIGKAERKLYKRIHDRLGGRSVGDAEAGDGDVIDVKPAAKPKFTAPDPASKPATVAATSQESPASDSPAGSSSAADAPDALTPLQAQLQGFMSDAGVSFDNFSGWVKTTGRSSIEAISYADYPDKFITDLQADTGGVAKCVRLYGKGVAK